MNRQLPDLLPSFSLTELGDIATELFDQYDLVPATHRDDLRLAWARVLPVAEHLGIRNAAELVTGQARLLKQVTGVTSLTAFPPAPVRADLHLYRNTVLAMVLATAISYQLPLEEILRASVRLTPRTGQRERPLTDDEILVLRLVTLSRAGRTDAGQSAALYALNDAGQTAMESVQAVPAHFDHTLVLAVGDRSGLEGRLLPLETYHQVVLAPRVSLAQERGGQARVAYSPRKANPSNAAAAASACGVLTRLLEETGLAGADVAPGSIRRWRVQHAWLTQGDAGAVEVSGRTLAVTQRLADARSFETASATTVEEF